MILAPIALQLTSPQPIKYQSWFSNDDFPNYLLQAGGTRRVGVRAVVRPDGTLQGCGIEASSGDPKLDQWTCVLVAKRARYTPARWIDGSAVFGVHRMPVTWAIDDPPSDLLGDVEITVAKLPPRVAAPAAVFVAFSADEKGQPLSCVVAPPSVTPNIKPLPTLVPIACDQLVKNFKAIPPQDDAGNPVRSVQNAIVKFIERK